MKCRLKRKTRWGYRAAAHDRTARPEKQPKTMFSTAESGQLATFKASAMVSQKNNRAVVLERELG